MTAGSTPAIRSDAAALGSPSWGGFDPARTQGRGLGDVLQSFATAARLGWQRELHALVAGDPALVHARGGDGQQPLHEAKTVAIADFLLDRGADAVACAAALDDARAHGAEPGPLHGVPVTIKDNVDVRGQRTPNGLPGLAGLIAPEDSPVTRNLLSAGAVLVGRTNTPEVSMRPTTSNPLYGLTLNPWDVRVSCGGSSGGAGVAVLAGFCAIGPCAPNAVIEA